MVGRLLDQPLEDTWAFALQSWFRSDASWYVASYCIWKEKNIWIFPPKIVQIRLIPLDKASGAEWALVWLFTAVDLPVTVEWAGVSQPLVANLTNNGGLVSSTASGCGGSGLARVSSFVASGGAWLGLSVMVEPIVALRRHVCQEVASQTTCNVNAQSVTQRDSLSPDIVRLHQGLLQPRGCQAFGCPGNRSVLGTAWRSSFFRCFGRLAFVFASGFQVVTCVRT